LALHRTREKQNASAESFIGRLRDECPNDTLFSLLAHARGAPIEWKADYDTVGHIARSAICLLPPLQNAAFS
jgi:hypothetical protein